MYSAKRKIISIIMALGLICCCARPALAAGLDVNAGEAKVNAGTLNVDKDVNVAAGATLTNSAAVNTGGNWTVNAAGIFTDSGTTTFDGTAAQTITSGGTDANHDFNNLVVANTSTSDVSFNDAFTAVNFTCVTASDSLKFKSGSTNTISNTFNLNGQAAGTEIKLRSSSTPTRFTLAVTGSQQQVSRVDVKDSNASNNNIIAENSINSGNNDNTEPPPHWVFGVPTITFPISGKVVGEKPTIIGTAGPYDTVDIYGLINNVSTKVATVTTDSNGSYRVMQSDFTQSLTGGSNSLTPKIGSTAGVTVNITVSGSPTTSEVPVITSPVNNARSRGAKPVITGQGKPNNTVTLYASDAAGNLLLRNIASSAVDASGNYTITAADYNTGLPKGTAYLNVTVDSVNSLITTIVSAAPFGVAFDSKSNNPIANAVVTIYDSAGNILVPGQKGAGDCRIDASDTNPQTVSTDGVYNYLCDAATGYRVNISAAGYGYPSVETTFPAGRVIVNGSKGESFNVGTQIIEMDQPLDPQQTLLKIDKDANKKEIMVGDIVTYTLQIRNLGSTSVVGVYIEDYIPPGFKYLEGRTLFNGVKADDPSGTRPLTFNLGTIAASATVTLKYQLVVGSGVTFGNYDNQAHARYVNGVTISNIATETVKIVPDPLFDLGTVVGKVFWDLNKNGIQDVPKGNVIEKGVAGARIATEDGTVVTTDKDGKFHIPMIKPGEHIFRIDQRSLPAGASVTTRREQIINMTAGILSKVNFGIAYFDEEKAQAAYQEIESPVRIAQDAQKPKPRLNACMYNGILVLSNAELKEPAEFRLFTNYSLFIKRWKLEIFDKAVRKPVDAIEGDRNSLFKPVFWDGKDARGKIIRPDRTYTYKLTVFSDMGKFDSTKEREFRVVLEKEPAPFVIGRNIDEEERIAKEKKEKWLVEEVRTNNLEKQNILLDGGAIKIYSPKARVDKLKVKRQNKLVEEVPLNISRLSAADILSGFSDARAQDEPDAEIILPRGKYSIEIEGSEQAFVAAKKEPIWRWGQAPKAIPAEVKNISYKKDVIVGEDYFFLVGLGNIAMGQSATRGNIEPVHQAEFKESFWSEGRIAYYLKGKIKGKYLITSSLDTSREEQDLFKIIDPDKYYPIYGDASGIDYEAQATQGQFYALIEWDKSRVKWGDYETNFKDTDLSAYSRTLYGADVYYESLSATQYGDPNTKIALFNATAKQTAARNEFAGTGGSLYYLKHKNIVDGSEKIELQVRDKINGMVLSTLRQKRGSDYQINYDEGRIIFWKPVSYIAECTPIISTALLDGNKVYVTADYEYETKDKYYKAARGGRVSQQMGNHLRLGGTYVKEEKDQKNYELKGYDATLRLGRNTRIDAEYATTRADLMGNFISTNGGIDFTTMPADEPKSGRAVSVKAETRVFDKVGVGAYYQKINKDFSNSTTISDQGTEKKGVRANIQITPNLEANIWHDIQKLTDNANEQAQTQVGAQETRTTTAQLAYRLNKIDVITEYRRQRVKQKIEGVEAETNADSDILAAKAQYRPFKKLTLSLEQEIDFKNAAGKKTTAGVTFTPNDKLTFGFAQSLGTQGSASEANVGLRVNEKINLIAAVKQEQEKRTASVGGEVALGEKESVYGTLTQESASSAAAKSSIVVGKKTKLKGGAEFKSEYSFIKSDKEIATGRTYSLSKDSEGKKITGSLSKQSASNESGVTDSNIFGLNAQFNEKLAVSGAFEKGKINNLDKTQSNRYAAALSASYLEADKFKASVKLEGRLDKAQEDTRQLLAYIALDGKVTRDLSLFNKTNISLTKNLSDSSVVSRYKEILTGFAYRPLYFDKWNIIGKYTYLDGAKPSGQEDFKEIEKSKASVFGLEGIYDFNPQYQFMLKGAFKQAQEKVTGFTGYTKAQTWLGILRMNRKFFNDYELAAEYRILGQVQAQDFKQGALLEFDRYFGNWMKLGLGYDFTGFTDDLARSDYSTYGWFLRATSSLGELAYTLSRTQEEKIKELKLDGQRRFAQIMQLPKQRAQVEEAIFYRDQAKHWIAIGEYEEAYNCLEKGLKRSKELRLDIIKEETERLAKENRRKIEELYVLEKKIRSFRDKGLLKISAVRSREEKLYLLLKLFYETGKIYFQAGQYKKAVGQWQIGLELIRESLKQ